MSDIVAAIERGLIKAAFDMERYAVRKCPVDTGRLRGSIFVKTDKNKITLGADTEYDKFVEFGTVNQRAQPFIRPAIIMGMKKFIPERIKEEISKL